jgi:MGT family glycosyltransferase
MIVTPQRYLVALIDAGGNVPPELGAVRRLVERGHTVSVLADDSVEQDVRATGADFLRWQRAPNLPDRAPENDPARDWECSTPWQLVERLIETRCVGPAAAVAEDVDAAICRVEPNAILCSMFCLGAMIAAESAQRPFAVFFPNVYLLPAEGLPPFGLGLQPARGAAGRLRDRALDWFAQKLWDAKGLSPLNALRAARELPPLQHLWDQVHRARRELVMTSLAFDFPARLPAMVRYVGPVLDDPTWAGQAAWAPPPGDGPLVLVALSSTFQDQAASLQNIVAALGTLPIRAIVTTGPALDPGSLHAPSNVVVLAAAPHAQVLPHASLVVTHGGHGTVIKALAAGVPLVVMPHGRDQPDNAARIVARGAGVALKRSARAAEIARAVQQVLATPSFAENARRLGERVRLEAESGTLIRELEALPHGDPG